MTSLLWKLLGGIGLIIAAYLMGRLDGKHIEQAGQLRADSAAEAQRVHDQSFVQDSGIAAALKDISRQTDLREITRETQTVVEKPVFNTVCVDAAGVSLLDDTVTVANGGGRSKVAGGTGTVPEGTAH